MVELKNEQDRLGFDGSGMGSAMRAKHTVLTKLTVVGLISIAVAIWIQWLSGDPAYPKFPPGPVIFIAVAAIVAIGTRWWWTPLIGALLALLVTAGWFALLPRNVLRLTHPGSFGQFTAGIFAGTLLQIAALLFTDIAGLTATLQNYRLMEMTSDSAKVVCRVFGGLFVFMGILAIISGTRIEKYHNLMQLTWGVLALAASFMGTKVAERFCIGSGVFYLALATQGLLIGNPSMNRAWFIGPMPLHTGDHIFHLVLGSIYLGIGLLSVRTQNAGRIENAPN
jgi:hypothetical protein